ncbi:hypothetical protein LZ31DRAFT_306596 [Colletotrichum somersetense]|nr:hypothetical protein LZ31DRAFT_306596 [Colletotrichum somersetense]
MGKLECDNASCPNTTWTSKKVAIVIRGYHGNGYNAVVFSQRCMSCKKLGSFTLNKQSYVEQIAYRLMRWAGVETEQPLFAGKMVPHLR